MVTTPPLLYPRRRPPLIPDDDMARSLIHLQLVTLFGGWSTSRVSRFLGVNARTVQRWMRDNEGEVPVKEIPDSVRIMIGGQQQLIDDIELSQRLHDIVDTAQANGVHPEVLGAHLSNAYRRATGREIE